MSDETTVATAPAPAEASTEASPSWAETARKGGMSQPAAFLDSVRAAEKAAATAGSALDPRNATVRLLDELRVKTDAEKNAGPYNGRG